MCRMRRALLAAIVLTPLTLAAQSPGAVEEPTAEYRATMRAMAAILLKQPGKPYNPTAEEAAVLRTKFGDIETFWASRNADEAVNFARTGADAAAALEAAAIAQDGAKVSAARDELTRACLGCHRTHVSRSADAALAIALPTPPGAPTGIGVLPGRGVVRAGRGVTIPRLVQQVKPQYTADAMRMKAQGDVFVECVVLPDGSVGSARVTRSLDPVFGLDEEAIKAARQWRFDPGTRDGQPVSVAVVIEMTFTLR
jgi:TonB family protein